MHVDSGKGGETERGPESSVDTKEDELEWEREKEQDECEGEERVQNP